MDCVEGATCREVEVGSVMNSEFGLATFTSATALPAKSLRCFRALGT